MDKLSKLDIAIAKVKTATDDMADRVAKLFATFESPTPAQQEELDKIVAHLESIGKDPENPAPPAEPSTLA